jgi:hypothetical protein
MINFMQTNQNIKNNDIKIVDETVWNDLYTKISNGYKIDDLINIINEICNKYNIDKKNIIKDFLNYIIRNYDHMNTPKYFKFVENIMHFEDCNNKYYVYYSLINLSSFIGDA